MKNIKELIRRFPLLIAALLVSLIGVYKDYSTQNESQSQKYDIEKIENVNSNKELSNGKVDTKNIFLEKINGKRIKIVEVLDGDSLLVRIDNTAPVDVRLYGVDAPELKQAYGEEAKRFLYEIVRTNSLENLEFINIDRYNRPIVILNLADGVSIQEKLLSNGMSWYYGFFCKIEPLCSEWKRLEENAKNQHLGLWAEGSAKAPWEWKRKN